MKVTRETLALFKALFTLEEIRELIRKSSPFHRLSEDDKERARRLIGDLRASIDSLEKSLLESPGEMIGTNELSISDWFDARTIEEDYVNIQAIQRGGVLTKEARKALISFGDGYSTCDHCYRPFRLDYIRDPPIGEFYQKLAEFVGMDVARVTPGARRAFQAVMSSLLEKGDIVIVSEISHYSLCLAVEQAGGIWVEVPVDELGVVRPEALVEKIESVRRRYGKLPKLVALEHVDYMYGNLHPVEDLARIAREYDIPFLLNGAYTVGIMPVNGGKIGADIVVGSGHKSFASPAPTGILALTDEMAERVLRTTETRGDVSGRKFGIKEVEMLGCTVMGAPLIAMMASFPYVVERVKRWDEELRKARYFADEFEKIEGNRILGQRPKMHTLMKVRTEGFDRIARSHKRKGYFLYEELKRRRITGIFPGASREFKLNVYGLSWEQVEYVINAFKEIAEKYGLEVSD